ncbi:MULTISPECIES: alpha/beta hydrolase [unclassified Sphingomonas]|uniref:alpha/beta fold hydrolase n=1 Tax=unclassified Sphingomonas TaxID=196159 RepID=UPI0009266BE0|nr:MULTISPECIES: alpha/beta hydrolase [unclassified Sphingomonas]MBN8847472.1 alpha/beta hydrolase [Sphingomonas sp.]OJV32661.1 MAG: alpha/beta hydrolase [Sphingomonas sp. 67-36]
MKIGLLAMPLALLGATPLLAEAPSVPAIGPIQSDFDDFGPAVQSLTLPSGRVVHFTDTGETGGRTVLFIGGTGTSARAAGMTDFLQTLRRQLRLRFIVVERNGFGDTAFKPDWGVADYAAEVRAVLDHLGVKRFAGVAISGGGPYMAAVASAMPERLISLHMLATAATAQGSDRCKVTLEQASKGVAGSVQNPQNWWAFPANSPTHRIPGFADRAYEEGARTFFIRGQMGDPTPEAAEMLRYCGPAADVSKVTAPVHIYQGGADPLVKIDQAEYWRGHFPNVASFRVFPGEGHDVQYRHWDQVLIELAGFTDQTVLCDAGKTRAVPAKEANALVTKGATLGICAWAKR